MRASIVALLCCCACTQPEDVFVLRGQLLENGKPRPQREVRLLRDASARFNTCSPMQLLETTTTDAEGNYRFRLLRQQFEHRLLGNRHFRVESTATNGWVSSWQFRFPGADVELPVLPVSISSTTGLASSGLLVTPTITETVVDDQIAWRTEFSFANAEDRDATSRTVVRAYKTLEVLPDSIRDPQPVELQLRIETLPVRATPGEAPISRGLACAAPNAGKACLLTDGRFLPVRLEDGTRSLSFDFGEQPLVPRELSARGLITGDRRASFVRIERGFAAGTDWSPYLTERLPPSASLSFLDCTERGEFFTVTLDGPQAPQWTRMRLSFLDDAREVLPIVQLSEVSFR